MLRTEVCAIEKDSGHGGPCLAEDNGLLPQFLVEAMEHTKQNASQVLAGKADLSGYLEFGAEAIAGGALIRGTYFKTLSIAAESALKTAKRTAPVDAATGLPIYHGIPELSRSGKLPPGVYQTTWSEFAEKFGQNPHRKHLLTGLQAAAHNLGEAGCQDIRIGGSFITAKPEPGDFDMVWRRNPEMDMQKLHYYLDSGDRYGAKYHFGGDIFSSQTELKFSHFFGKVRNGDQLWTRDRRGLPSAVVSIDPATVPESRAFQAGTFDLPQFAPDL